MIRQFELVERVKAYDPSADEDMLNRAYVFSMKAHGSQKRASGDPYFSHPLEVAEHPDRVLKLDTASIVTGAAARHRRGHRRDAGGDRAAASARRSRRLVDGVTKLTRLELQSDSTKQAENFRKLVLAMSRTSACCWSSWPTGCTTCARSTSSRTRRSAAASPRETMEIYAPLAERIGMDALKAELEDLAFGELNPDARRPRSPRAWPILREQGADLMPQDRGRARAAC